MVRLSKWISGATAQQPVTEVARKSLRARLRVVWHYAPLAAHKANKDIEYVHQLRVASRRAKAAMELYAELLPPKRARAVNKLLRDLRKAAGEARDLDVLAGRLSELASPDPQGPLQCVLLEIKAQRKLAQPPLLHGYQRASDKDLPQLTLRLLSKIRCQDPVPNLADFGRNKFKPMVEAFFAAAAADLSDAAALHRMRISGKQVRYAIELLAGAFDDSFRQQLYPVFGDIQERLGAINDHVTAIALLTQWSERTEHPERQAALEQLAVDEKLRLDEAMGRFQAWWTAQRAAELAVRVVAAIDVSLPTGNPAISSVG
jgi:CHAD domain-containing protein